MVLREPRMIGTCTKCGGEVWEVEHYRKYPKDQRTIRKHFCVDCKIRYAV